MAQILITGGAGFIGSNFIIDWLSNSDEKVINIDKLTYAGNLNNLATLRENKKHIFLQHVCHNFTFFVESNLLIFSQKTLNLFLKYRLTKSKELREEQDQKHPWQTCLLLLP